MKILGNWPLCAAIVWTCALAGVGIHGYLKPTGHTVFHIYAVASRSWVAAEPDLYATQPETKEFFRYSPLFAVLTVPLAVLPPGTGNGLWKVLNGLVFLGGLVHWTRRGIPGELSPNARAGIVLLALPVAMMSLQIGQANLMMTGFVLFGATAVANRHWWSAAAFIAAATLIKVFPIAFAAVLAVVFWRQFSWRFVIAMIVGLGAPFAAGRPQYVADEYRHWFSHLVESEDLNRDRLKSLDKLLEVMGLPVEPRTALLIGAVAGLGVLAVTAWYAWKVADRRAVLTLSMAWFMAWALLFSPSTEAVTFAMLAPALAWGLVVVWTRPGDWLGRVLLIASFFLLGPAQTDLITKTGKEFGGTYAAPTIGTVAFVVWLIAELFPWRKTSRSAGVERMSHKASGRK